MKQSTQNGDKIVIKQATITGDKMGMKKSTDEMGIKQTTID